MITSLKLLLRTRRRPARARILSVGYIRLPVAGATAGTGV